MYSPRKYYGWFVSCLSSNIIALQLFGVTGNTNKSRSGQSTLTYQFIQWNSEWWAGPVFLFPAVFGQRLDETVAYEQKFGPHLVPILVEKCAEFILQHGLNEEGIFRLPGQDNLVKQLRDAFDAGERPSFDRYPVFTVPSPCLTRAGTLLSTSWAIGLAQLLPQPWLAIKRAFCFADHLQEEWRERELGPRWCSRRGSAMVGGDLAWGPHCRTDEDRGRAELALRSDSAWWRTYCLYTQGLWCSSTAFQKWPEPGLLVSLGDCSSIHLWT